jgi:hypothetical protein
VGLGPGVDEPVSRLTGFDEVPFFSESEAVVDAADVGGGGGGGSITEGAGDGFEIGSGNAGMGSSADDVSMVICLVAGGFCCLSV